MSPSSSPLNHPRLWGLRFVLRLFQKQNLHCLRDSELGIHAAERAGCLMKENF